MDTLNLTFPDLENAIALSSEEGIDLLATQFDSPFYTQKTGEHLALLAKKSKPGFTGYFYSCYKNYLPKSVESKIDYYLRLARIEKEV